MIFDHDHIWKWFESTSLTEVEYYWRKSVLSNVAISKKFITINEMTMNFESTENLDDNSNFIK